MKSQSVVWNKIIRITHWLIAGVVILNLLILEEGDPPHRYLGYFAVAAVVFRILYGFLSQGAHAFSNFPLSVSELKSFVVSKLNKENKPYTGHNPAASVVYILVWLCIILLGVTGWMMGLDRFFGEDWLEEVHEAISLFLELLIIAHFIGMALDSIQFKRKTWLGMITGKK